MSKTLNYILDQVDDVSAESFILDSTSHDNSKTFTQTRETSQRLLSPETLTKISQLFQLEDHHSQLKTTGSINLTFAQEIFATLPLENSSEVSKCTKMPSNANLNNIVGILEKNIQASKEELLSSAVESLDIVYEKLAIIRQKDVVNSITAIYTAFCSLNKDRLINAVSEPHIVYTKQKEFIKIDLEPLSELKNIYSLIVDWDDKSHDFAMAVNSLSQDDMQSPTEFLNLFQETITINSVFHTLLNFGDKSDMVYAVNQRPLDIFTTKANELRENIHHKTATTAEISQYFHMHDAVLTKIDMCLDLANETKVKKFLDTIDNLLKVLT